MGLFGLRLEKAERTGDVKTFLSVFILALSKTAFYTELVLTRENHMTEPSVPDIKRLATTIQRELENMTRDGELAGLSTTWGSGAPDRAFVVTVQTSSEINLVSLAHRLLKSGAV